MGVRRQIALAGAPFAAAGAGSFQVPHETVRKPLHVRTRDTKQMHAFVKLIRGMRPPRSQHLEFRSTHAEVAGDPLQLALIHRVQLAAAAPPLPNRDKYEMARADLGFSEVGVASSSSVQQLKDGLIGSDGH
jgi:hypothetical protein